MSISLTSCTARRSDRKGRVLVLCSSCPSYEEVCQLDAPWTRLCCHSHDAILMSLALDPQSPCFSCRGDVTGIAALRQSAVAQAAVSEATSVWGSDQGGTRVVQHLAQKLQEAAAASSPVHVLSQR